MLGLLLFVGGVLIFVGRDGAPSRGAFSGAVSDKARVNVTENKEAGPSVVIGSLEIPVEVASTSAAIQKGLSGRPSLDPDRGMLFVFTVPDRYRFWMPDMHFPIDIIWIDTEGTVVGVSENTSADFDPENPLYYVPPIPAQYVLEVNAGFAASRGIGVGDKTSFRLIE